MGELKKVGFTSSLQTNVCAPDPQKVMDLQVRHDGMHHNYIQNPFLSFILSIHTLVIL